MQMSFLAMLLRLRIQLQNRELCSLDAVQRNQGLR